MSPGVLIPSCMHLMKDGYGVEKQIPSTLIASASFSDIIAIELFGIFTQIEINRVEDKQLSIFDDFVLLFIWISFGLVVGLVAGLIVGFGLKKFKKHLYVKLVAILIVLGIFLFIVEKYHIHEALFIATLAFAYVVHQIWKDDKPQKELQKCLKISKPFLFGTIGAAIKFEDIELSLFPMAILIILVALLVRCLVTYVCVWRKKFNVKERLVFVAAWTPKATVQAVLGGFIYDWAKYELSSDNPQRDEYYDYGNKMLTASIIAIFVTAPIGAILTENLGRKFLHKKEKEEPGKKAEARVGVEPAEDNAVCKPSLENNNDSSKKSTSSENESSKSNHHEQQESNQELKLPDIHQHRHNRGEFDEKSGVNDALDSESISKEIEIDGQL